MSWAGIANNQCVSFANLKDAVDTGVFISKTTQSTSNEQITKANADTYVYIDTSYSPYSSKSSNQLVVKSDLRGGFLLYGASYGCVIPETQILIAPNITQRADELKVNDNVFTQHEVNKTWGYFKIQNIERKSQPLLKIITSKGELTCSTTHLLFKMYEYVEAKTLFVGDVIGHVNGDASILEIISQGDGEVIEFTVEDAHTYVGAGFLSHNKCITNSWGDCAQACTNGATAYTSSVQYTGVLQVGTIISATGACGLTTGFFYYVGGYIELSYNGTNYEVASLGSCGSCLVTVTFYGVMGDLSNTFGTLYYSTDNSTWNPIAQSFSYTCGVIDAVSVTSGDTVYISIGDPSSTVYYYNATTGTSCPTNSATYCGLGSVYSVVANSNLDIAITQYVVANDILAC